MDGWNSTFLLGRPILRDYVSFMEGMLKYETHSHDNNKHILRLTDEGLPPRKATLDAKAFYLDNIRSMVEKSGNHHLECIKPCK